MTTLIDRRDLLKLASAALASLTTAHKGWSMPAALVQNVARASGWTPAFLNAHQNETVVVLTELIIPKTDTPGAAEANVNRYIDLFLSVSAPADQQAFTSGLAALDDYSKNNFQKEFVKCAPSDQTKILDHLTGLAFFNQLKGMTSSIYYSTPEGYKELNKFGPPPAPNQLGCAHASH